MKMELPLFWRRGLRTIRVRVLAIVAVPCAVLLILGTGAAGYNVDRGNSERTWAGGLRAAIPPAIQFVSLVQEERRLTLLRMGGDIRDSAGLDQQRQRVNVAVANLNVVGETLFAHNPSAVGAADVAFRKVLGAIPSFREAIDAGHVSRSAAYAFYNNVISVIGLGLQAMAQSAPDPTTAAQETTTADLFNVLESMSESNALGAGDVAAGRLSGDDPQEFRDLVGAYHTELQQLVPRLNAAEQAQYLKLVASPAWRRLTAMENAVIDLGGTSVVSDRSAWPLPLSMASWQNDAHQMTSALTTLWSDQHLFAESSAGATGERTFVYSLLAGAGVLIITILAMLVAIRLSSQLVRRMKRLRAETLELADKRLPEMVQRLRAGGSIDLAAEISLLDHGQDEIGEVADAFNAAQRIAVAAAAQEAKTREGMNSVFLNIAHRSQVVVRRQLEVLDQAEGSQEDPVHLELLFQLDHLATRARRNAENLVILGGERPGRRWRNPVPLEDIARSAVSETAEYARVGTVRLPEVTIYGGVVADLLHLLAELVDNATSFSPPDCQVEIRGNLVGRGVVIEIEDQGLGIVTEQRNWFNAMLSDPPDFQLMALWGQPRLGLFVVAQLAARHNITVTLVESVYGGVCAVVLIPGTLIAEGKSPAAEEPPRPREDGQPAGIRNQPEPAHQPVNGWPGQSPPAQETAFPAAAATRPWHAIGNGKNQQSTQDSPAPLPRRRPQQNPGPQFTAEAAAGDAGAPAPARSPEQARNTMAAVMEGTRQSRQTRSEHRP